MKDSTGAICFTGFVVGLLGGFLVAVIPDASVLVQLDKETQTPVVLYKDRFYKLVPLIVIETELKLRQRGQIELP